MLKIHDELNLKDFTCELDKDSNFLSDINLMINKNNIFKKRNFFSIYEFSVYRNFLYSLIRNKKFNLVLETGVLHGLTSAWILKALKDNDNGKLISIDLPRRDWKDFFGNKLFGPGGEAEFEIKNEEPGWAIPLNLKNYWELYLGPSSKYLNKILADYEIDLFIHDSDHSYDVMQFECETIQKKKNIDLVIDDHYCNDFYINFSKKYSRSYIKVDDINDNLCQVEGCVYFPKINK